MELIQRLPRLAVDEAVEILDRLAARVAQVAQHQVQPVDVGQADDEQQRQRVAAHGRIDAAQRVVGRIGDGGQVALPRFPAHQSQRIRLAQLGHGVKIDAALVNEPLARGEQELGGRGQRAQRGQQRFEIGDRLQVVDDNQVRGALEPLAQKSQGAFGEGQQPGRFVRRELHEQFADHGISGQRGPFQRAQRAAPGIEHQRLGAHPAEIGEVNLRRALTRHRGRQRSLADAADALDGEDPGRFVRHQLHAERLDQRLDADKGMAARHGDALVQQQGAPAARVGFQRVECDHQAADGLVLLEVDRALGEIEVFRHLVDRAIFDKAHFEQGGVIRPLTRQHVQRLAQHSRIGLPGRDRAVTQRLLIDEIRLKQAIAAEIVLPATQRTLHETFGCLGIQIGRHLFYL